MISKKNILSLAVLLATAALTACGDGKGSSGTEPEAYIAESLSRSTSIRTVLSGPKAHVALNNNLLFDPNTGRLNIPVPEDEDQSILNPKVAMNYADGFSTSMPIYIAVDGRGFGAGVPVTEGVSLFNVNTSSKLTYGVDFVASTLKDQIIIVPRKPFEPSSNYVLVLTNQIKDMQNEPIGMSGSYAGLKSHTYTQGKLAQAQQLMQKQEQVAQAGGIDPQTIVYSSMFTTGSVGDVMIETAKVLKKIKGDQSEAKRLWPDEDFGEEYYSIKLKADTTVPFKESLDNESDAFKASDFTKGFMNYYASLSPSVSDDTNVTRGTVKLPYFLETGSKFDTTPFEPANPEASVVNRYNPIPKIKALQEVEFILFTPKQDVLNGLGGNLKGLVIYQHGVTSVKEDAYSFAADLVAKGLAVIAIDHPIHGKRAVNGVVAYKKDATPYLNLAALPVARDNMRQSVLDILGLRLALEGQYLDILSDGVVLSSGNNVNTDSALELNSTSIKFLGHSLGGIIGNTAMAIANKTGAKEYQFSSAVFAMSGGHIAELLGASGTFGRGIKEVIALKRGLTVDSLEFIAEFTKFKIAAQTLIDTVDPHSVVSAGLYPKDLPTLLIQVENDETVPNNGSAVASSAPTYKFIGTENLARAFEDMDNLTKQAPMQESRIFAKYNDGGHLALLASSKPLHTKSMRELTIDFLVNDKQTEVVDDTNGVLAEAVDDNDGV